jgi:hypothetical protein
MINYLLISRRPNNQWTVNPRTVDRTLAQKYNKRMYESKYGVCTKKDNAN